MLTNSELVLGAAGIGVLGSAIGGLIGWLASLGSAREQRRLEADRRRDDRRAKLYQDMAMKSYLVLRRELGRHDELEPSSAELLEEDDLEARVHLFASPEVSELWNRWEGEMSNADEYIEAGGQMAKADMQGFAVALNGAQDARRQLVEQMRVELESWAG